MSEQDNGGMAFPMDFGGRMPRQGGMTLRDYFAAKAMQAYVTRGGYPEDGFDELISKWAYEISDAMIAARSQP